MPVLSDLRYIPSLTLEELDLQHDMVPVWHPAGLTENRALSLQDLRTLIESTSTGTSGTTRFNYKADAQTTQASDPGTGKLRWNNATQINSTALYVDWITTDGFDPVYMFQTSKIGAQFTIQDADFSNNRQVWKMTGPAENMPDWFIVRVQFISSSGNPQMKHNGSLALLLEIGEKVVSSAGQVIHNKGGNLIGNDNLVFDGKTLRLPALPTSAVGLPSGSLWNNAGVLNVIP